MFIRIEQRVSRSADVAGNQYTHCRGRITNVLPRQYAPPGRPQAGVSCWLRWIRNSASSLSECVRVDNVLGWIAPIYQESLKTNKRVDSKDTVPIITASLKGVSFLTGSEAMQASDYPLAENRRSPARKPKWRQWRSYCMHRVRVNISAPFHFTLHARSLSIMHLELSVNSWIFWFFFFLTDCWCALLSLRQNV